VVETEAGGEIELAAATAAAEVDAMKPAALAPAAVARKAMGLTQLMAAMAGLEVASRMEARSVRTRRSTLDDLRRPSNRGTRSRARRMSQ